ncbi:MAG TPA: Fe-S cluster assembly protein IscX [Anaerolineales bacterium]|nr:Fe-S cluster assembly protein IscX [Anaerolineales bacterium]HRF48418.1 Fe-S cluster assembly protein IscX [Anaerolineales bacterium]
MDDLYWDASYALARRLAQEHPEVDFEGLTLNMVYNWVIVLPDFKDDPELVNDELLEAIFQEWYESRTSL